jgi:hypothetical protein
MIVGTLQTGYSRIQAPKLWQEAGRATTHCRVSRSTGSSLPVREGSGVAVHPTTPDPTTLFGGLQGRHASHGTGPCLPAQRAPEPQHVPRRVPLPMGNE